MNNNTENQQLYTGIKEIEDEWKKIGAERNLIIEGSKDAKIFLLQICKNYTKNLENKGSNGVCIFFSYYETLKEIKQFCKERLNWDPEIATDFDSGGKFIFINKDFEIGYQRTGEAFSHPNVFDDFRDLISQYDNGLVVFNILNDFLNIEDWKEEDFFQFFKGFNDHFLNQKKNFRILYSIDFELMEERERKRIKKQIYEICHTSLIFDSRDVFNDGRPLSFLKIENKYYESDTFWIPYYYIDGYGIYTDEKLNEGELRKGFKESGKTEESEKMLYKQKREDKYATFKKKVIDSLNNYHENRKTIDFNFNLPFKFPSDKSNISIGANRLISVFMPWSAWENNLFLCHITHSAISSGIPVIYLAIDDNPDNLLFNWSSVIDRVPFKEIINPQKEITLNHINRDIFESRSAPLYDAFKNAFLIDSDKDNEKQNKKLKFGLMHYINATGGGSNYVYNPPAEEGYETIKNVKNVNQLPQIVQKIQEIDEYMLTQEEDFLNQSIMLIINTYSGIYTQLGPDRAFKFLQRIYNDLVWKAPKNRYIFNIIQRNMIPEAELRKIEQHSDAIIDFTNHSVLGNTLNAISLRGGFDTEESEIHKDVRYFFKQFNHPIKYLYLSPTLIKDIMDKNRT